MRCRGVGENRSKSRGGDHRRRTWSPSHAHSPGGHSFLPTAKRFSSIMYGVPGTQSEFPKRFAGGAGYLSLSFSEGTTPDSGTVTVASAVNFGPTILVLRSCSGVRGA